MPVKPVAARLNVAPSTVSYWVRDIKLTEVQVERNQRGPTGPQNPEQIAQRVEKWRETCRARRRYLKQFEAGIGSCR